MRHLRVMANDAAAATVAATAAAASEWQQQLQLQQLQQQQKWQQQQQQHQQTKLFSHYSCRRAASMRLQQWKSFSISLTPQRGRDGVYNNVEYSAVYFICSIYRRIYRLTYKAEQIGLQRALLTLLSFLAMQTYQICFDT